MEGSRLKLTAVTVMALLLASTFLSLVSLSPSPASAQLPSAWTGTTAPIGLGERCIYSPLDGIVVCNVLPTNQFWYATDNNGIIGTWSNTTAFPAPHVVGTGDCSLTAGVVDQMTIFVLSGRYVYVLDQYGIAGSAIINAGGIGSWSTSLSSPYYANCDTIKSNQGYLATGGYLYTVNYWNFGGASYSNAVYSVHLTAGSFGTWNSEGNYPNTVNGSPSCILGSVANILCIGGSYNNPSTRVYTASISGATVGAWSSSSSYPITISSANCVNFQTQPTCIGGVSSPSSNTRKDVYYLSTGTWFNDTHYFPASFYYDSANANLQNYGCVSDNQSFIDCMGGGVSRAYYVEGGPSIHTLTISNMDCQNCLIAGNGKFYQFNANVSSQWADPMRAGNISFIYVNFNDSLHYYQLYYDVTKQQGGINGAGQTAFIGNVNTTDKYLSVSKDDIRTVSWKVQFTANLVNTINRAIYLEACVSFTSGPGSCTGIDMQHNNYFNFVARGGGLVNSLSSGTCLHQPKSGSAFGYSCTYNASPQSHLATNETWIDLQSYATQFAYNGTGTSSVWPAPITTIGFYFWDNNTWVLGPNIRISPVYGLFSQSAQYERLHTLFYFGNTLLSNQTLYSWNNAQPTTHVNTYPLYLDMWYSVNNASTTFGMRVNAQYFPMKNNCGWFCFVSSNWGAMNNGTTTEQFGTIKDHTGTLYSSSKIECTKVFWSITMTTNEGADVFGANQYNVEQFNLASTPGEMGGVNTPVYTAPVIPAIQSTGFSFFGALYSIVLGLGTLIAHAFYGIAIILWNAMGTQFPWLTTTLSNFYLLVTKALAVFLLYVGYLVQFLVFLAGLGQYILYPVTITIAAWNYISNAYISIFGNTNIALVALVFFLAIFSSEVLYHAERGETSWFVGVVRGIWGIGYAIFDVLWKIAKFIVDAIEGLIP